MGLCCGVGVVVVFPCDVLCAKDVVSVLSEEAGTAWRGFLIRRKARWCRGGGGATLGAGGVVAESRLGRMVRIRLNGCVEPSVTVRHARVNPVLV